MREKCLELLADSARASANKLKFFRLAFGAGGRLRRGDRHPRGARPRSRACSGPSGGSSSAGWSSDGKLPKGAVKLLLNLALLAGRRAGSRRPARCRRRAHRRADRAGDPRRGPANPARPGASRDARARRERRDGRAARRGRLAGAQPCRRGRRLDPAVRPVDDVLMIGATLPTPDRDNAALTPPRHKADRTQRWGRRTPMDDLIADFVAECREMLEALGGEIVAWEAEPDDRARLDSHLPLRPHRQRQLRLLRIPAAGGAQPRRRGCARRRSRRPPPGRRPAGQRGARDHRPDRRDDRRRSKPARSCPAGDDSALIAALDAGAEGPLRRSPPPPKGRARRRRRAAHHPLVRRAARPGDEHRFRHGAGAQRACPPAARIADRRRRSTARSSACRRSSPRCATRSPARACSGSRICSSLCRAWFATCPPSSASRSWSTSRAATSSSIAR